MSKRRLTSALLVATGIASLAACSSAPSKTNIAGTWVNTNQHCLNTGIMKMNLTADSYIHENVRGADLLAVAQMSGVRIKLTDQCEKIDKETVATNGTYKIDGAHLVITVPNGWGTMAEQPPLYIKYTGGELVMASDPGYKSDVETFKHV